MSTKKRSIDILLVGDEKVGKTTVLRQLCTGMFSSTEAPTIGIDARRRTVDIDGIPTRMCCWDLGGSPRYRNMVSKYCTHKLCVVLVFSLSSEESLASLAEFREAVSRTDPGARMAVLGNAWPGKQRTVTREQIEKFCGRELPYCECTATDRDSVEAAFAAIIEAMLPSELQQPPSHAEPSSASLNAPLVKDEEDGTDRKLECCGKSCQVM